MSPTPSEYNPLDPAQLEQDTRLIQSISSHTDEPIPSPQTQPHIKNPLLTNFFRNRNLSDTSVDSHPALIDHRSQSHSLGINSKTEAEFRRMIGAGSGGSKVRGATRRDKTEGPGKSNLNGNILTADNDNGEGEEEDQEEAASPRASSSRLPSRTTSSNLPPFSSTKPKSTSSIQRIDSLIPESTVVSEPDSECSEEEVLARSPGLSISSPTSDHRQSPPSLHDIVSPSPMSPSAQHLFNPSVPSDLSRRPSLIGKPEEDVCFPHLDSLQTQAEALPEHHSDVKIEDDTGEDIAMYGIPGVLPGFFYPFDFEALEEFARKEKEDLNFSGLTAKPDSDFDTFRGQEPKKRPMVSFRKESDGEVPPRRKGNRKLSESLGGSRLRQKKLALFEEGGASSSVRDGDGFKESLKQRAKNTILDIKTPLLDGNNAPAPGPYDRPPQHQSTKDSRRTQSGDDERPYRFSFYSNSIPSTIHSKSLSEIPADDQTFEEIFTGRRKRSKSNFADGNAKVGLMKIIPGTGDGAPLAPEDSPNLSASHGTVSEGKFDLNAFRKSLIKSGAATPTRGNRQSKGGAPNPIIRSDEDAEANTWWLDVLCPTDAEMKALSKVS
jgi:hypothetical protein